MVLSIFRTYRKPIKSALVHWSTAFPHGAALGDASIHVGAYLALTPPEWPTHRRPKPSPRLGPIAFMHSRNEKINGFTYLEGVGLCVPARNPDDFFRDVLW